MKPYKELSRLGQLRRLRKLANAALDIYGLSGSRLNFVQYSGNVVYRVDTQAARFTAGPESPYIDGRYVLRIHSMDDVEAIASEIVWLDALSREAGLPVPKPVPNLEGEFLITVTAPDLPRRTLSLLRWLDGRLMTNGLTPKRARAWGRIVGKMHAFASTWKPPADFNRPHWNWQNQLGGEAFSCPFDELVASIPVKFREPFQAISGQARQVMADLGEGPDAYGLIHSDMYPENILYKGDEVFPIDLEDCGFGYWIWDIAVALCQWPWTEEWHWIREAFLNGYTEVRRLPDAQLKHLDLFMATQYATMVLWASVFIRNDQARRADHEAWRERDGAKLLQYVENRAGKTVM